MLNFQMAVFKDRKIELWPIPLAASQLGGALNTGLPPTNATHLMQ
jgi:hypothetical protein